MTHHLTDVDKEFLESINSILEHTKKFERLIEETMKEKGFKVFSQLSPTTQQEILDIVEQKMAGETRVPLAEDAKSAGHDMLAARHKELNGLKSHPALQSNKVGRDHVAAADRHLKNAHRDHVVGKFDHKTNVHYKAGVDALNKAHAIAQSTKEEMALEGLDKSFNDRHRIRSYHQDIHALKSHPDLHGHKDAHANLAAADKHFDNAYKDHKAGTFNHKTNVHFKAGVNAFNKAHAVVNSATKKEEAELEEKESQFGKVKSILRKIRKSDNPYPYVKGIGIRKPTAAQVIRKIIK